jgi:hypothetical protein
MMSLLGWDLRLELIEITLLLKFTEIYSLLKNYSFAKIGEVKGDG